MLKLIILLLCLTNIEVFCQKYDGPIVATFGGLTNGKMTKDQILKADSIVLFYRGDYNGPKYRVIGFQIDLSHGGGCIDWRIGGNSLDEKAKNYVKEHLQVGRNFWFLNIKAHSNSDTLELNSINLIMDGPQGLLFTDKSLMNQKRHRDLIRLEELLLNEKLHIGIPDSDGKRYRLLAGVEVTSYTAESSSGSELAPLKEENSIDVIGNKIPTALKSRFKNLKSGDYIYFNNIKGIDREGQPIEAGSLRLEIR